MNFGLSEEHEEIRRNVAKLCERYDGDYWLARDRDGGMPEDFIADVVGAGWLGIAMPEAHGGAGLGITEAAILMQTIAQWARR